MKRKLTFLLAALLAFSVCALTGAQAIIDEDPRLFVGTSNLTLDENSTLFSENILTEYGRMMMSGGGLGLTIKSNGPKLLNASFVEGRIKLVSNNFVGNTSFTVSSNIDGIIQSFKFNVNIKGGNKATVVGKNLESFWRLRSSKFVGTMWERAKAVYIGNEVTLTSAFDQNIRTGLKAGDIVYVYPYRSAQGIASGKQFIFIKKQNDENIYPVDNATQNDMCLFDAYMGTGAAKAKTSNLRTGPGFDNMVVDNAVKGETLKMLGADGDWTAVDKDGQLMYIHNQVIDAQISDTPVDLSGSSGFSETDIEKIDGLIYTENSQYSDPKGVYFTQDDYTIAVNEVLTPNYATVIQVLQTISSDIELSQTAYGEQDVIEINEKSVVGLKEGTAYVKLTYTFADPENEDSAKVYTDTAKVIVTLDNNAEGQINTIAISPQE